MDVSLVIRQRLKDLGLEQRGLAVAAHVTESYVSQLLARKKAPPAPRRTDIYDRMEAFLELPPGELARLAEIQRREELKRKVAEPVQPLFTELRALILRKCAPRVRARVRVILEKEPYGELERLVGRKFLDVARGVAREESGREKWLRLVARLSGKTLRQIQVTVQKILETKTCSVPVEPFIPLLEPLIEAWTIDLDTFALEVALNRKMAPEGLKRFEFLETEPERASGLEPGLRDFFHDESLSGDATEEETRFLKTLRLKGRRPTSLYYYRELQNLRDPLHFRRVEDSKEMRRTFVRK